MEREQRFRTLTDLLPVSVWEATASGQVIYVNPAFTRLTGLSAEETSELPLLGIVHPNDCASVIEAAANASDLGEYETQYRVRHVDGSSRWVRSRMAAIVSEDGAVGGFVGTIEDVDALRQAERYASRLAAIIENTGDAVAVYEDGEVVFVNQAATDLFEQTDPSFSVNGSHVFKEQIRRMSDVEMRDELRAHGQWSGDVTLFAVDGRSVHYSVVVTVEDVSSGRRQLVVQGRDIGQRKQRESELKQDARHDPLTGLANRVGLEEHIAASPTDISVALLYVDIDHFKRINDDHGHAIGDAALRAVAARLRSAVTATDIVARVGGDEIVVWSVGTTESSAEGMAERLVGVVNATPIACVGVELAVTCTIGLATGVGSEGSNLMERADAALYLAKKRGRNRWIRSS